MKVYGYPVTRSARAVWVLEEAGAQYDYQLVDLKKGEARQAPYLQLNPGGKVLHSSTALNFDRIGGDLHLHRRQISRCAPYSRYVSGTRALHSMVFLCHDGIGAAHVDDG